MAEQEIENSSADMHELDDLNTIPFHDFLSDLESQTSSLMNSLQSWRELTLTVRSILLWEKNYYASAIFGGSALFFLCLWLLEPSILTTLSIMGLTFTVCDYVVPIVATSLFKPEHWDSTKQKAFYDFCNAVVIYKEKIFVSWASFYLMRTTKPKTFYGFTILTLVVLAWLGNAFNNLFLTFVFVTILLLTPGMERHGILYKWGKIISQKFVDYTKLKISQPKKVE